MSTKKNQLLTLTEKKYLKEKLERLNSHNTVLTEKLSKSTSNSIASRKYLTAKIKVLNQQMS